MLIRLLAAGTRLLVPTADRAGAGSATAADGVVYIVRGGDTLSSVARDHSVTRDDLASWNGIGRNDPLLPGQKLRIVASEGPQPRRGRSTGPRSSSPPPRTPCAGPPSNRSADHKAAGPIGECAFTRPPHSMRPGMPNGPFAAIRRMAAVATARAHVTPSRAAKTMGSSFTTPRPTRTQTRPDQ